mmetsp:Transcript_5173/g.15146  ORF Transcript_5173/g.15146 Transcript_5173/m.15146 type:complete len:204 (+) Transcript_5173:60-671(+)
MFSLAAAVAALAPPSARADVQRAWRAPVPPVMLWRAAQRHITFSSITDDAEAISKLRQIAEEISTWSGEDWAMFNAPAVKLRLDTQGSDRYGAVVLEFLTWGGSREGALGIELEACPTPLNKGRKRLLWTTKGSRRETVENVLFKLFLEEVRSGSLSSVCRLKATSFLPASSDAAFTGLMIQNRRLREELREMKTRDAAPASP